MVGTRTSRRSSKPQGSSLGPDAVKAGRACAANMREQLMAAAAEHATRFAGKFLPSGPAFQPEPSAAAAICSGMLSPMQGACQVCEGRAGNARHRLTSLTMSWNAGRPKTLMASGATICFPARSCSRVLLPALQVDQVCTGLPGCGVCAGLWCLTDGHAIGKKCGTHNMICLALSSPIGTQQQTSGASRQGQTEV